MQLPTWNTLKRNRPSIHGGSRAMNATGAILPSSFKIGFENGVLTMSIEMKRSSTRNYPYDNYANISRYSIMIVLGDHISPIEGYEFLDQNNPRFATLNLTTEEFKQFINESQEASNQIDANIPYGIMLPGQDWVPIWPYPSLKECGMQVACSCPDFTYTFANADNQVTGLAHKPRYFGHTYPVNKYPMGLREYPKDRESRNPRQAPGVCKHIHAVVDYLIANRYVRP